jgi:hypothetical protein
MAPASSTPILKAIVGGRGLALIASAMTRAKASGRPAASAKRLASASW